ncbi:MAG: diaminopimelate epimerase [Candidatus Omnitrophota bacterium]
MKKIEFTKMVASGNDFVVAEKKQLSAIRYPLSAIANQICNRKYGIGADGLLILEKTKAADIRMRVFNADGSEAEMCGNGARCVALWLSSKFLPARQAGKVHGLEYKIQTKAGIIKAQVNGALIRIKLTDPAAIKLNVPIRINKKMLHVNFVNTGVPHAVIFVEGLDKIEVVSLGRQVRFHKAFSPAGANVDFVEALNDHTLGLRTYERGVEDETLACGTGAVASALAYVMRYARNAKQIRVHTQGKEILKVYFERTGHKLKNVWLEGKTKVICKGAYYV